MIWHDVRDPNDPELDALAERYHLHPLHVEDCRHKNQRAKAETGDGYVFVVRRDADGTHAGSPGYGEGRHIGGIAGGGEVAARIRGVAGEIGGAVDESGIVGLAIHTEYGGGEVV